MRRLLPGSNALASRPATSKDGRKSHAEIRPDVVELANRLRHTRSGKQRSLREISAELAKRGHVNNTGRPFAAMSIRKMVRRAI
jgi:hypothetical protein